MPPPGGALCVCVCVSYSKLRAGGNAGSDQRVPRPPPEAPPCTLAKADPEPQPLIRNGRLLSWI